MTSKEKIEALKKQLILHPSYLTIIEELEKDLEVLEFLIEKMYVAGGLIELKVCPLNNPTIPKWHNGIETHDSRFNDFIGRINELKYKR